MHGISSFRRSFARLSGKELVAEVRELAFRLARDGHNVVTVAKAISAFESGRRAAASAPAKAPSDSSSSSKPSEVPKPPSPAADADGLVARKRRRSGKGSAERRKQRRAAKQAAGGAPAAAELSVAGDSGMDEVLNAASALEKAAARKEQSQAVPEAAKKLARARQVAALAKSVAAPALEAAPAQSASDDASSPSSSKRVCVDLAAAAAAAQSHAPAVLEQLVAAYDALLGAVKADPGIDQQLRDEAEDRLFIILDCAGMLRSLKLSYAACPEKPDKDAVAEVKAHVDAICIEVRWLHEHAAKVAALRSEQAAHFRKAVELAFDPLDGLDAHLYR